MDVADHTSLFLAQAAKAADSKARENTPQTVYAASEHLRAALGI